MNDVAKLRVVNMNLRLNQGVNVQRHFGAEVNEIAGHKVRVGQRRSGHHVIDVVVRRRRPETNVFAFIGAHHGTQIL